MRCESCQGRGWIVRRRDNYWVYCPDCGGSGVTHCCEGDRAQPEPWSPGEACIPPMSQK